MLTKGRTTYPQPERGAQEVNEITAATTFAAGRLAEELDAKILIVASGSGETARTVSKHRRSVPVIGVSDSDVTLRRMCLYWGVVPLAGSPVHEGEKLLDYVVEQGRLTGQLAPADRVVLVYGSGIRTSQHNMIVVHQID